MRATTRLKIPILSYCKDSRKFKVVQKIRLKSVFLTYVSKFFIIFATAKHFFILQIQKK